MEKELLTKKQMSFANIFIISNRLQTACEKIQSDITMKQWLMLAIASNMDGEKNLTRIGKLMGCSRQNVKRLAKPLEEKGYVRLVKGFQNSLNIEVAEKYMQYSHKMSDKHIKTLNLLFDEFNEKEIIDLFNLYKKLENGLAKVESFGETMHEEL